MPDVLKVCFPRPKGSIAWNGKEIKGSSFAVEAWDQGLLPVEVTVCHLEVAFPLPIFLMPLEREMAVCEGNWR